MIRYIYAQIDARGMEKIANVKIVPGCISCGTCESICPDVFEVKGVAEVKPNPDVEKHAELIREAVDMCPVSVIKIEKNEG